MNKKVAIISAVVVATLIGGATYFGLNKDSSKKEENKEIIKVQHALGETEVSSNPKKVVVFDYAVLDAMQALEIDSVAGVPQDSSIPEYLSEYKGSEYVNIGGLKEPNLEKINEIQPDLIIINGRQNSFYEKFSEIAPTISLSKEDGKYMESVTKNMEIIGNIFDKEDEVKKELENINKKIEDINKEVVKNNYKATTLMASEGNLSVFGADSRFGIIYNEFGFKNTDDNIAASDHGQDVSYEYVANQDVDFMFVIDKSVISNNNNEKAAKELLNNDLVNNSKVAKEGKIVYLDTHSWYLSDGGIISTNSMIDEIKAAITK